MQIDEIPLNILVPTKTEAGHFVYKISPTILYNIRNNSEVTRKLLTSMKSFDRSVWTATRFEGIKNDRKIVGKELVAISWEELLKML